MLRNTGYSTVMVIVGLAAGVAFAAAPPELPVDQNFSASAMYWAPEFAYDGATLVVSGGDGTMLRHDFGPGETIAYGIRGEAGMPLADGNYTWQLTVRRALTGAEQAALKAAEEEAGRLRAEANSLRLDSAGADAADAAESDAQAKRSEPVDPRLIAEADRAAQDAEQNIESVREQLEMRSGPFAVKRSGWFAVSGGAVEFGEDEVVDLALKAQRDSAGGTDVRESSGRRGPAEGAGDVTAEDPGLKLNDPGDVKAASGLLAGDPTFAVNPGTGQLILQSAVSPNIELRDTSTGVSDFRIEHNGTWMEFETDGASNMLTLELSPIINHVLWVDNNGNVGMHGETAPLENLHITDPVPGVLLEDSDDATYGMLRYNAGGLVLEGNSAQNIVELSGTAPGNSIYVASSGNVGLGSATAPPTDGKFTVWDAALPEIVLADTAAGGEWGEIELQADGDLQFTLDDGTTTRTTVTFDSGGAVGIGTTVPDPAAKIHIEGPAAAASVARIDGAGGQQIEYAFYDGAAQSGRLIAAMGNTIGNRYFGFLSYQDKDGARLPIRFFTQDAGGTLRQSIFLNAGQAAGQPGWLGVGRSPNFPIHAYNNAYLSVGGVWTNASSRDFKTDIHELSATEAFEALSGMQPVQFRYKDTDNERHVGFIAEDVPELVATADRKGLSTMDVVAVLTKVVQEQQRVMQEQQAAIEELRKQLDGLTD